MNKNYNRNRKGSAIIPVLAAVLFGCLLLMGSISVSAATTVYNGVDYAKVYDFDYYVEHNAYVKNHFANDPEKALRYFVKKGMKKRQQACASFDVNSYINGCRSLRRAYKNNYKKYYLHYIKKGYKSKTYVKRATGYTEMKNYAYKYAGVSFKRVYDYNYYVANNKDVKKKYGVDDVAVLEDFIERGMLLGLQGNATFDVAKYMEANPDLKAQYGSSLEKYYTYYARTGKGSLVVSEDSVVPIEDEVVALSTSETGGSKKKLGYTSRTYANETINGQKTLKSYLQNALVPCGRTLYIWGGGWDDSDACIIGYQPKWETWFKNHATSSYDYSNYRYSYGNGLDCSGFAAWTLYNTLYTKSGGDWLVFQSTTVASTYSKKGWVNLKTNSSDQTYRPGDVVSMNGHVWISLGECSDGSVLLVHSSPKGVQISGTSGQAATLATHYMKKYFPEWPYAARTVSSSYLSWAGKGSWKVSGSGHILNDPDGIQKMSANQVMKLLLGS